MIVKYCGAARDYSGYGEAARNDISALVSAGVKVIAEVPKYTSDLSDFGALGILIDRCEKNVGQYDIKIIHTTPNVWGRHIEPGKYHIGRLIWETDKLPSDFVAGAQLVDEIWTGCEYTKQAIINSGIKKKITVVPEAIDLFSIPSASDKYILDENHDFNFYSIFEWGDRKNPQALLKAYWNEFGEDDNVGLYIKTYYENFNASRQRQLIGDIKSLKKSLHRPYYAPVYIIDYLMDRHQIYRFHRTFDCFVSTHRGEGWGIPQMEAMVCKKPIISTNIGGIHEWLKSGTDAYTLDYELVPITKSVKNPQWYTQDMKWAEINLEGLQVALRFAYSNTKENARVANNAHKTITKEFDTKVVGKKMLSLLESITI